MEELKERFVVHEYAHGTNKEKFILDKIDDPRDKEVRKCYAYN